MTTVTTLMTQVGGGERKRTDGVRGCRMGCLGYPPSFGPGWMPPWKLGLGYTRRIPIRGDILPLAAH